jgi:predicted ABC-class ATPase
VTGTPNAIHRVWEPTHGRDAHATITPYGVTTKKNVRFHADLYPTREHYPFNLDLFHRTNGLEFRTPVTFFVGENGTGKSTLLEAIARRTGIHVLREGIFIQTYEAKT